MRARHGAYERGDLVVIDIGNIHQPALLPAVLGADGNGDHHPAFGGGVYEFDARFGGELVVVPARIEAQGLHAEFFVADFQIVLPAGVGGVQYGGADQTVAMMPDFASHFFVARLRVPVSDG